MKTSGSSWWLQTRDAFGGTSCSLDSVATVWFRFRNRWAAVESFSSLHVVVDARAQLGKSYRYVELYLAMVSESFLPSSQPPKTKGEQGSALEWGKQGNKEVTQAQTTR